MPTNAEAGVRPQEVYWVEETTNANLDPVTPENPTFKHISNTVRTFDATPQIEFSERTGLGRIMPHDANRMQESHELSITYDLERFPVNASGSAQDPFAYAAQRDEDNLVEHTLSFLRVEDKASVQPGNSMHSFYFVDRDNTHPTGSDPGASVRSSRIEYYVRGAVPSEMPLPLQPGDQSVIQIESSWVAHEVRPYQFDQPESETLVLRSSDAGDTGTTVTVETDDGSQSEQLSLDGTDAAANYVTSSQAYSSLRVHTSGDHVGNVEVYAEGATAGEPGELLAVVFGEVEYDGIHCDSGVPMIGDTGSFEDKTAVNWTPQLTLGTETTWDSRPLAETVTGATITISNEIAQNNTDAGAFMDIRASTQETSVETSVYGETESVQKLQDHLKGKQAEIGMELTGGTVTLPRTYIADPGTPAFEEETATAVVEATWTGMEPDTGLPLQFTPN